MGMGMDEEVIFMGTEEGLFSEDFVMDIEG